jgi:hypothetical protein
VLVLASCASDPQQHGVTGVEAVYSMGTLESRLPGPITVASALAAGEQVFRERGWTILRQESSLDRGFVLAQAPDSSFVESVQLSAQTNATGGTHVRLRVDPLGNRELTTNLFDSVLEKLGL